MNPQVDYHKSIQDRIAIRELERSESYAAYQQLEESLAEVKRRIIGLDGALLELRELAALSGLPASEAAHVVEVLDS